MDANELRAKFRKLEDILYEHGFSYGTEVEGHPETVGNIYTLEMEFVHGEVICVFINEEFEVSVELGRITKVTDINTLISDLEKYLNSDMQTPFMEFISGEMYDYS